MHVSTLAAQNMMCFIENKLELENIVNWQLTDWHFFEPALKLWHHFQDLHEFAIFPVKHCDVHQLQSDETSIQYVLRPEYNWPWINP